MLDTHPESVPSPSEPASRPFDLAAWFSRFMLYVGVVAAAGTLGLYFLYKIPMFKDMVQMFKSVSSMPVPKKEAAPPVVAGTPPHGVPAAASATPPTGTMPHNPNHPAAPATAQGTAAMPSGAPGQPLPVEKPADPTAATPEQPAQPLTPQQEIEQLLAEAQQHIDNRKLTAPAGANALASYQKVLALQPDHAGAQEGIQKIATSYYESAKKSLQQGRPDESLSQINRGLRVVSNHSGLLELRQSAQQAKRRQQQEAARRQQEAERRRQQQEEAAAPSSTAGNNTEPASERTETPAPARTIRETPRRQEPERDRSESFSADREERRRSTEQVEQRRPERKQQGNSWWEQEPAHESGFNQR